MCQNPCHPDHSVHRWVMTVALCGVCSVGGVALADGIQKISPEAQGFNTEQSILDQRGFGDIQESPPEEKGFLGGFATGQEIQPDDEPPLGVCRRKNDSQGVTLWDPQGSCLSERREGVMGE
ncbi:MAG: hypothetical protein H7839_07435 [Magnetococcus sp. YQC-5]